MKTFNALCSALIALSASASFAADAMEYKTLGFSKDGRYFAFVETVMQDGSGFPEATATVVDVRQNKLLRFERAVIQDENGDIKKALKQAIDKVNPAQYGIDAKIKGETLWIRMPTDLSAPELSPRFSTYYGVEGGASTVWPRLRVDVSEKAAGNVEACYGFEGALLKVTLHNESQDGERHTVLQEDSKLPKSRECSSSYQPRQIIEYKGAIVVVIRHQSPGFEGPDYNHMIVTHGTALKQ